jgi:hypothetical protein
MMQPPSGLLGDLGLKLSNQQEYKLPRNGYGDESVKILRMSNRRGKPFADGLFHEDGGISSFITVSKSRPKPDASAGLHLGILYYLALRPQRD